MSEQDWIERLREQRGQITGEAFGRPLERVLLPAHLWPLLCDVVEGAEAFRAEHPGWSADDFNEDSILEALQGEDAPGNRLDAALAALRVEVEK